MPKTIVIPASILAEDVFSGDPVPPSVDNPPWTFKKSLWCVTGALMALNQKSSCEPLFEARESYSDAVACKDLVFTLADETHATLLEGFKALLGLPNGVRGSFRLHLNAIKNAYSTREEALKSLGNEGDAKTVDGKSVDAKKSPKLAEARS